MATTGRIDLSGNVSEAVAYLITERLTKQLRASLDKQAENTPK